MQFFDKITFKIAISCFLAPSIFIAILLLFEMALYQLIQFNNYIVTKSSLLGCVLQPWKTYNMFILWAYELFWIGLSYSITKKGYQLNNVNLKIVGSFLLFPAIFLACKWWMGGLWFFLEMKKMLFNQTVPFFVNRYYLQWLILFKKLLFLMLLILVSKRIVTKFWDKKLRINYFTLGIVATFLGWMLWFRLIGDLFVRFFS
jgi:hypothetical protein